MEEYEGALADAVCRRWLIGAGGFHEHGHTMFGLNEMFWYCFICWCLSIMTITKVFMVTKDFEHNNYAHVQQAHHAITIAVVAYLLQDVTSPPPALFLTFLRPTGPL